MRAAIIGAGGVGLGVGSCLLEAGAKVEFVVRSPEAREQMTRRGIERTGIFGDLHFSPNRFEMSASLEELRGRAIDLMLVCTKTTASRTVASELSAIDATLPDRPEIVLFQNGWGNTESFAEYFPRDRIFNARVITGFLRRENRVEVTVHAEPIRLGSLSGANSTRLSRLCDAISRGGIPCELSPSIAKDLWAKLLYNCALNPLGALRGVCYGEVGQRVENRELLETVVREVFAVMRVAGYETYWPSPEKYLEAFYAEILPPTAAHESSMLQDLREGRPTEMDALCGAVVALGAEFGVATPVNAALSSLVRACESRPRDASSARRRVSGP